jgi:hypothetical protein
LLCLKKGEGITEIDGTMESTGIRLQAKPAKKYFRCMALHAQKSGGTNIFDHGRCIPPQVAQVAHNPSSSAKQPFEFPTPKKKKTRHYMFCFYQTVPMN